MYLDRILAQQNPSQKVKSPTQVSVCAVLPVMCYFYAVLSLVCCLCWYLLSQWACRCGWYEWSETQGGWKHQQVFGYTWQRHLHTWYLTSCCVESTLNVVT